MLALEGRRVCEVRPWHEGLVKLWKYTVWQALSFLFLVVYVGAYHLAGLRASNAAGYSLPWSLSLMFMEVHSATWPVSATWAGIVQVPRTQILARTLG